MRTVRDILEDVRRLPPEERLRLLEYLEESLESKAPLNGPSGGPYATSLRLSGSLQTDFADVSSDKYKHVAEASRDSPPKQ